MSSSSLQSERANLMKKHDTESSTKPKPFKIEVKCVLKEEPAQEFKKQTFQNDRFAQVSSMF